MGGRREEHDMTEPEIHTWWPSLTADAKHALDALGGETIPDIVRDEVEILTGVRMSREEQLTIRDREFIRTQGEVVD
jgi:hypothetical protein